VCVSLLTATVASAADHRFGSGHFSRGRWTYTPVFDTSNTVVGFLALAKPGTTVGENINAVWLERQGSGAGSTWSSAGWYLGDQALAARSVATALSVSEESLTNLPFDIGDQALGSLESEAPAPMARGLFADDPLQSLLESTPAPGEAVEELVSAGYAAARLGDGGGEGEVPPEEGGCDWEYLYSSAIASQTFETTGDLQEAADDYIAQMTALGCPCLPWVFSTPPTPWVIGTTSNWTFLRRGQLAASSAIACWYTRFRLDQRSVTRVAVDWTCTTTLCTQTQTRKVTEEAYCLATEDTCPPTPDCSLGAIGTNAGAIVTTQDLGWLPLCPWE
jgi:hypothetical protein